MQHEWHSGGGVHTEFFPITKANSVALIYVKAAEGATLHCAPIISLSLKVSVLQDGKTPEAVKEALAQKRINVSVSPANSTLLDFSDRGLHSVVRASVHYYNTEQELGRFIQALQEI